MIRERRQKKRRLKFILKLLLGFVILMGAAAFVVLEFFTVENVEIEGNQLYDDAIIKNTVLNDEYCGNSLYVYLKYRFTDTEAIPFIDTMDITLKDPRTLHINVYEKGMMGYLYIPGIGENAYFDKDGFVVETSSEIISGVPEIAGITCDVVVLYEQLPIERSELKNILTLTQTLKRSNLVPDRIVYGSAYSPVLCYGQVNVQMGSMELLTQKVERIANILPTVREMSGVLHLENWSEETKNIVFDKSE